MLMEIPPRWASGSFTGRAAVGQRPSPQDQYAALLSWLIKCSPALSDTQPRLHVEKANTHCLFP